jgi:hypothetical protein
MATRQARIFVPTAKPFDDGDWAETALARVVGPITASEQQLDWFWFLRYVSPVTDSADCDISGLPPQCVANGLHRSIRFRYSLHDDLVSDFEASASEVMRQHRCWISDWRDYGALGELGGNRFCGSNNLVKPSAERAELVAGLLCSVARVVLHCLVPKDGEGRYQMEHNTDSENPNHSTFESIHHLFCNMTGVPTTVLIYEDANQNAVRTHWMPPPPKGFRLVTELSVNY